MGFPPSSSTSSTGRRESCQVAAVALTRSLTANTNKRVIIPVAGDVQPRAGLNRRVRQRVRRVCRARTTVVANLALASPDTDAGVVRGLVETEVAVPRLALSSLVREPATSASKQPRSTYTPTVNSAIRQPAHLARSTLIMPKSLNRNRFGAHIETIRTSV
jgi:hypothetical protein